jgi:hypothetical protein
MVLVRKWDMPERDLAHKKYIDENPVKAGLAKSAEEYPYCSAYFRKKKKTSG